MKANIKKDESILNKNIFNKKRVELRKKYLFPSNILASNDLKTFMISKYFWRHIVACTSIIHQNRTFILAHPLAVA